MVSIRTTWTALGHRTAVVAGAGTGLVALLGDVPPGAASLRGAGAWLAVLVVFRGGGRLLEMAARREPTEAAEAETGA